MAHQFGLKANIIEGIREVFAKTGPIEKAIIYGSRAIGNYKVGSDIDITLVGSHLTLDDLLRIETELDNLFLPYKIDLSLFHQIENSDLVDHIHRRGVEFYKSCNISQKRT